MKWISPHIVGITKTGVVMVACAGKTVLRAEMHRREEGAVSTSMEERVTAVGSGFWRVISTRYVSPRTQTYTSYRKERNTSFLDSADRVLKEGTNMKVLSTTNDRLIVIPRFRPHWRMILPGSRQVLESAVSRMGKAA